MTTAHRNSHLMNAAVEAAEEAYEAAVKPAREAYDAAVLPAEQKETS